MPHFTHFTMSLIRILKSNGPTDLNRLRKHTVDDFAKYNKLSAINDICYSSSTFYKTMFILIIHGCNVYQEKERSNNKKMHRTMIKRLLLKFF